MSELVIKGLHVSIEGKEILKGLDLTVKQGEVHALMGPNGTGKSTLAYTLMGHPSYTVTGGEVWFKGKNILELQADQRSRLGLFLAFQYPVAIPGVTVANFLRTAVNARRRAENPEDKGIPILEFRNMLKEKMSMLKMDSAFAGRYLNDGFSGGEKKRAEILQMAALKPEIAILDETDSGLDIDALRIVADGVNALTGPELGALVITHYQRLLNYIKPQFVHIMLDGRIVESGGPDLALHLEEQGYDWVREKYDSVPEGQETPAEFTGITIGETMSEDARILEDIGQYKYGFHDVEEYVFKSQKGLSREVVENISRMKDEPQWMLDFRLKALDHFMARPMPTWGPDISGLHLDDIFYYVKPTEGTTGSWDDVPDAIKNTFDKLGIPEAERKFLAGVGAQYESEMVYHSILEHLEKQGVIFLSIEDGLRQHPDLFREYFSTVIPIEDNKFAALNSAVWSGGSFVYVPKGVKVDLPLQAYFRLNTANVGQFERSLIIVDEDASVHYVEGCTAPQYTTNSFHSGVIEIVVKRGARSRYSTIQNWSTNVYNLVTQRAKVFAGATHEWVDANLGSKVTMKYPSCYLMEPGAHGEMLSMAFAGPGQIQDAGSKMIHFAPNTTSKVISKSISKGGGQASFRGLLKVYKGAAGAKSSVVCDALLLDPQSRTDTYPTIEVDESDVTIGHEASVSKVGEEQLFYLMSRGLSNEEATTMVVSGFIEPLVKELPMEYAVEMNRLIQLQMEGSIG